MREGLQVGLSAVLELRQNGVVQLVNDLVVLVADLGLDGFGLGLLGQARVFLGLGRRLLLVRFGDLLEIDRNDFVFVQRLADHHLEGLFGLIQRSALLPLGLTFLGLVVTAEADEALFGVLSRVVRVARLVQQRRRVLTDRVRRVHGQVLAGLLDVLDDLLLARNQEVDVLAQSVWVRPTQLVFADIADDALAALDQFPENGVHFGLQVAEFVADGLQVLADALDARALALLDFREDFLLPLVNELLLGLRLLELFLPNLLFFARVAPTREGRLELVDFGRNGLFGLVFDLEQLLLGVDQERVHQLVLVVPRHAREDLAPLEQVPVLVLGLQQLDPHAQDVPVRLDREALDLLEPLLLLLHVQLVLELRLELLHAQSDLQSPLPRLVVGRLFLEQVIFPAFAEVLQK